MHYIHGHQDFTTVSPARTTPGLNTATEHGENFGNYINKKTPGVIINGKFSPFNRTFNRETLRKRAKNKVKKVRYVLNTPTSIRSKLQEDKTRPMKEERIRRKATLKSVKDRRIRRSIQERQPQIQEWPQNDVPMLKAFDCSQPKTVRKLAYDPKDNCNPQANIKSIRNVQVRMLQKSTKFRHKGYRCELKESRRVWQCGGFDHMIAWNKKSYFNLPRKVSAEKCQQMRENGIFVDDLGQTHTIRKNGVTILNYDLVGKTYTYNGEIECEGEDFVLDGQGVDEAVIHIQQHLTIVEEEITADEGILRAENKERTITCDEKDKECVEDDATYLWEVDMSNRCPFYETRIFQATWATGDQGEDVVMSSDGSLVRVIAEDEVVECGERLFSTNYDNLYIQEVEQSHRTWQKMDPKDVEMQTYIANRDDSAYHIVTHRLKQEFRNVLKHTCKQFKNSDKFQFLAQQQGTGVNSWFMENGTFATVGGETVFTYKCKEVIVSPRRTEKCYQAMPVQIIAPKEARAGKKEWFLEPNTRRLTTEGISVRCSAVMAPNMKAMDGRWISYGRVIQYVEPPSYHAMKFNWTALDTQYEKIDWVGGGVYKKSDVNEYMLDFKRIQEAIQVTMTGQILNGRNRLPQTTGIGLSQMFPTEELYADWTEKLFGPVFAFFGTTGKIFANMIGVVIIYQGAKMLLQTIHKGTLAYQMYGASKALITFCCIKGLMATSVAKEFGRKRRDKREEERLEQQLQQQQLQQQQQTQPDKDKKKEPPGRPPQPVRAQEQIPMEPQNQQVQAEEDASQQTN